MKPEIRIDSLGIEVPVGHPRRKGKPEPGTQGRRARGPKPPPVGEGCICDGSGRTCPRHGAVI